MMFFPGDEVRHIDYPDICGVLFAHIKDKIWFLQYGERYCGDISLMVLYEDEVELKNKRCPFTEELEFAK